MKEPHVVPLPPAAVALLRQLRQTHQGRHGKPEPGGFPFTFSGTKPISDMTMLKVLRDMKVAGATVHGFRSTFTDWFAECTSVPKEIADKALAHRVPNAVEAAYRRTDFFDKRRELMDEWAAYLAHENKA